MNYRFIRSSITVFFLLIRTTHASTPLELITTYESSTKTLTGQQEDKDLIDHFAKSFYQIKSVENIGLFYIDSRVDIIKNKLRNGEVWEKEIVDLIHQYAVEGSTVLDIGSHIGTHTVTMSKKVGPTGRVIAFEPQKKIFAELVMNMKINSCQNVKCYRCAIGNSFSEIEMNLPVLDNEGGTSIGKGGDQAQVIPLDFLELGHVSLMKIDVENTELEVIKGARKTILKNHPVIIIEIMGNTYQPIENRSERIHEILRYIEEMGYQLSFIPGSWSDWLAKPLGK